MNILLLSSAYNTLTQHAHVELKARQHRVGVAVVGSADDMAEAVEAFQPDLILCPMLTRIIPSSIWDSHRCIILHPGIIGDRGSASLDWAILNEEPTWGRLQWKRPSTWTPARSGRPASSRCGREARAASIATR